MRCLLTHRQLKTCRAWFLLAEAKADEDPRWSTRRASLSSSIAHKRMAYLYLDGVGLGVRRPAGRKCVQMLVAWGVA